MEFQHDLFHQLVADSRHIVKYGCTFNALQAGESSSVTSRKKARQQGQHTLKHPQ
jgi:hypothetical protein